MDQLKGGSFNKLIAGIRILLGIIFIMTGLMKIFLPKYSAAWTIQIVEAHIPFHSFTYYFVPILEIILGIFLFLGYFTKIATLLIFPLMIVAIYVHLTVTHPGAFPSQPQDPYMPIAVLLMAFVVLTKGGGK